MLRAISWLYSDGVRAAFMKFTVVCWHTEQDNNTTRHDNLIHIGWCMTGMLIYVRTGRVHRK